MSFIDYNFFPILFFLGWNILTTKQFSPSISNTSNSQILPGLSIFSLINSSSGNGSTLTEKMEWNPSNQKIIQTNLRREKKINILEFVSKFQFLSENQKLISKKNNIKSITKPTQWVNIALMNENSKYYFTRGLGPTPSLGREKPAFRSLNPSIMIEGFGEWKRKSFPFGLNPSIMIEGFGEWKRKPFPFGLTPNNYNLLNNHWKTNFKSNLFNFT